MDSLDFIAEDLRPLARPITDFTPDPANTRHHDDRSYEVIGNSIKMFRQRKPIVAQRKNGQLIVRAGNGTLEACKRIGMDVIAAVIIDEDSTSATAYAVSDNKTAEISTWDESILRKTISGLLDEGVCIEDFGFTAEDINIYSDGQSSDKDRVEYTKKIEIPIYQPKGEKPEINELTDSSKTDFLVAQINSSNLPEDIKTFLVFAAQRHRVFKYDKIAEYYCHAGAETQQLFENSALVIIDFDKAIENGFVKLTEYIADSYIENQKIRGLDSGD